MQGLTVSRFQPLLLSSALSWFWPQLRSDTGLPPSGMESRTGASILDCTNCLRVSNELAAVGCKAQRQAAAHVGVLS